MISRLLRWLFPILVLVLCLPHQLSAQTTSSGALTGVVTDPSAAVVPDAVVEVRDIAKGTVQSTKTDRDGVYQFFFLAPSRYTLTVTHDGFRKLSLTVSVLLGPPGTVNVTLEIATASTAIKVTGEAPFLQAENGDVSTTMNEKQISEVPNPGNDLTYFAQTAPGAIMNTEAGGLGNVSILGMPGTSNLFTINGMNDNSMFLNTNNSGALGMMLGQNEVEEASIVNNGYSAQFGGAAGSNINYSTKSQETHSMGMRPTIGTDELLTPTTGLTMQRAIRGHSISRTSGQDRSAVRSSKINCSSFLILRECTWCYRNQPM